MIKTAQPEKSKETLIKEILDAAMRAPKPAAKLGGFSQTGRALLDSMIENERLNAKIMALEAENEELRQKLGDGPTKGEQVLNEALKLIADVRDSLEL
jgi:hypothetical protein